MDVPATLVVLPWADPVIDPIGHDPRSRYVELFWLGVLGPTATLLLRRFADGLESYPDGFELDVPDLARSLGIKLRASGGPRSPTLCSAPCCSAWRSTTRTASSCGVGSRP
jgi:hypothetical protein